MLLYKRALLSLIPLCHASFDVLYSNSFDALAKRGIDIPDNDTTESQCSLSVGHLRETLFSLELEALTHLFLLF